MFVKQGYSVLILQNEQPLGNSGDICGTESSDNFELCYRNATCCLRGGSEKQKLGLLCFKIATCCFPLPLVEIVYVCSSNFLVLKHHSF